MMTKRENCVAYIGLSVELHGCVENSFEFLGRLRRWLESELDPDYVSDIDIEITESTGMVGKQ